MSDPYALRTIARDLEQTQVKEVPGGITGFDTFYATGTWVPAFTGATIAGTFTYAVQVGYYTRTGNVVFVGGRVAISAIAVAPTGASMYITGLPFTSANVANLFGAATFGFINNINTSAAIIQLTGYIAANTSRIVLAESFDNAGGADYPAANFTNAAADLVFTGQYFV